MNNNADDQAIIDPQEADHMDAAAVLEGMRAQNIAGAGTVQQNVGANERENDETREVPRVRVYAQPNRPFVNFPRFELGMVIPREKVGNAASCHLDEAPGGILAIPEVLRQDVQDIFYSGESIIAATGVGPLRQLIEAADLPDGLVKREELYTIFAPMPATEVQELRKLAPKVSATLEVVRQVVPRVQAACEEVPDECKDGSGAAVCVMISCLLEGLNVATLGSCATRSDLMHHLHAMKTLAVEAVERQIQAQQEEEKEERAVLRQALAAVAAASRSTPEPQSTVAGNAAADTFTQREDKLAMAAVSSDGVVDVDALSESTRPLLVAAIDADKKAYGKGAGSLIIDNAVEQLEAKGYTNVSRSAIKKLMQGDGTGLLTTAKGVTGSVEAEPSLALVYRLLTVVDILLAHSRYPMLLGIASAPQAVMNKIQSGVNVGRVPEARTVDLIEREIQHRMRENRQRMQKGMMPEDRGMQTAVQVDSAARSMHMVFGEYAADLLATFTAEAGTGSKRPLDESDQAAGAQAASGSKEQKAKGKGGKGGKGKGKGKGKGGRGKGNCWAFQTNSCGRGEACRFRHEMDQPGEAAATAAAPAVAAAADAAEGN